VRLPEGPFDAALAKPLAMVLVRSPTDDDEGSRDFGGPRSQRLDDGRDLLEVQRRGEQDHPDAG
jgi:hypothetical protein